ELLRRQHEVGVCALGVPLRGVEVAAALLRALVAAIDREPDAAGRERADDPEPDREAVAAAAIAGRRRRRRRRGAGARLLGLLRRWQLRRRRWRRRARERCERGQRLRDALAEVLLERRRGLGHRAVDLLLGQAPTARFPALAVRDEQQVALVVETELVPQRL